MDPKLVLLVNLSLPENTDSIANSTQSTYKYLVLRFQPHFSVIPTDSWRNFMFLLHYSMEVWTILECILRVDVGSAFLLLKSCAKDVMYNETKSL